MEVERICVQGRIGPVSWLRKLEVVFPLISNKGSVKCWLTGSLANDENSIQEHVEVKVYGKMLGNLLVGEQLIIFSPARKPGKKVKR